MHFSLDIKSGMLKSAVGCADGEVPLDDYSDQIELRWSALPHGRQLPCLFYVVLLA